jgi:hypothetical protein
LGFGVDGDKLSQVEIGGQVAAVQMNGHELQFANVGNVNEKHVTLSGFTSARSMLDPGCFGERTAIDALTLSLLGS